MTQRYLLITIGVLFALNTGEVCAACAPPPVRQFQTGTSSNQQRFLFQSQQIMAPVSNYNGTVYTPFTSEAPSEQSYSGEATSSPRKKPGSVRTFIGGPEGPSGPSPVGEPWVLGLLAVMMAGWRAIKRRKSNKKIILSTD